MTLTELTRNVGESIIRLQKGDIVNLQVDAIVYYARSDLQLGSGFGGAISVRGGPAVPSAGDLKAHAIIHAVGPKFQEENLEVKLRQTLENVITCAEGRNF